MPKGLPSTQLLTSRRLQAFTLDTSVIESSGFRLDSGPMKHLSTQLPPWLQLWMSEIVISEVNARRNAQVAKSIQLIRSGLHDLQRHMGSVLTTSNMKWIDGAPLLAGKAFTSQMERFIKAHSGLVVGLNHPQLSRLMFNRYFGTLTPFEGSKDKKNEFPDAAALLSLELKAKESHCDLIVVSQDNGWASFAAESDRMYCVPDIQSLTALYVSTSPLAKQLREAFEKSLESQKAPEKQRISEAIQKGLRDLPWHIQTPKAFGLGIDAGLLNARIVGTNPNSAAVGVWLTSSDEKTGVIEVGVDVSMILTIEAVAFEELLSGEKQDVAHTEFDMEYSGEVKVILEMEGDLTNTNPWENVTALELRPDPMIVKIEEIDFGGKVGSVPKKSRWWLSHGDWDDDLPF